MIDKRVILILIFAVLLLGLTLYSYGGYESDNLTYPKGPVIGHSNKVLVVAPHPDDETIANAGIIRYCVKNKIPVHVVVVTNGENFRATGIERHSESMTAMKKLGLKSDAVTFLDYPENSASLFNQNWGYNNLFKDENGTSHSTNSFAYELNAPYCGENLEKNLKQIIEDFQPTIIIYPDGNDKNPDHWTTSAFVDYATNKLNYTCKKYGYLTHTYSQWPYPRSYNPDTYLVPPPELSNQSWVVFPLNGVDESLKFDAIKSYSSQITPDASYIIAFVKKNELFSVYSDINVSSQKNNTNYFKGSSFPPTIFQDPENDLLINEISNLIDLNLENTDSFDLTSIGFEMDQNTTWLSLKTMGAIANNTPYEFHIRTFGSDNASRIDIWIQNGKASYEMFSQNSVKSHLKIKTVVKHDGVIVEIPSNIINSKKIMISADVMNQQGMVDRTAWRTVNIV
ncbi:PIG-L deacetylase family protein [Methanobacterium paludis]|uniref:LmbE family protein n=1 Tax=Methanobacterium paludis (strain DSM 25820 / JCM 18151 / SWAN1) TaxID=868131 RepID=F6D7W7_METPW|nr:PIG-L family deacetylase [Methanobacterium paludis]AEG18490.1 LmbE family protein [Methanobacterium paludis]